MAVIIVPDDNALLLDVLELERPAQINRSAWTSRSKTVGLPGAPLWYAKAHVRNANTERVKRHWRAFITALRGMQNSFRLRVTRCQQTDVVNPKLVSGAANATTLTLSGLPASTSLLAIGDYMTVRSQNHEQLVMLMQPLVSNASGQAVAIFEPELCEAATVGADVEIRRPWLLAKQMEPRSGWSNEGGRSSFQFDVVEAR